MNRKELLRHLVENPANGKVFWNLAESLFRELQGRKVQDEEKALWAAVCYRLAAYFQDTAETWGKVGARLAQLRLAPLAQLDCFRKSLDKDPHNAKSLKGLALTLKRLGRYNEALEYYELACQQGKVDYEIYLGIGECYHHLGRHERAQEYFQKTLQEAQAHKPAAVSRVQNKIRQLGYGDLLPATAKISATQTQLQDSIEELARHGLPEDLAKRLQAKVRALPLEEGQKVVNNVKRYWDLCKQGSITEEDFSTLVESQLGSKHEDLGPFSNP